MRNTKLYIALLLIVCALLFTFTACAPTETPTPEKCPPHADANGDGTCDDCGESLGTGVDLSGVSFADESVYYDGEAHYLQVGGEIPEDVSVEYIGNGKTDAGVYEVTAKFYLDGEEIVGEDLTATLEIKKANASLGDISVEINSAP